MVNSKSSDLNANNEGYIYIGESRGTMKNKKGNFLGSWSWASRMEDRNTPIGIVVISALVLFMGVLNVMASLVVFIGSLFAINELSFAFNLKPVVLIFLALLIFAMGIFEVFVANGLLNLKSWARICVIVISTILVLSSITAFFFGYYSSILNGMIAAGVGGYLGFSGQVRRAFSRQLL